MRHPITLVLLTLTLLLPACGGGGGGGAAATVVQVTLVSTAALDGYVDTAGNVINGNTIAVGDADGITPGLGQRGFLSFNITGLPAGATITSAILRVSQLGSGGTAHTDVTRGPVIVDHLDYGPTLDAGDFNGVAILLDVGAILSNDSTGYATLDVTARLVTDIANASPRTQYRLRFRGFDSNNNGTSDFVAVEDGEDSFNSGELPQLVVTYTTP